jgi:hypothetical protein
MQGNQDVSVGATIAALTQLMDPTAVFKSSRNPSPMDRDEAQGIEDEILTACQPGDLAARLAATENPSE